MLQALLLLSALVQQPSAAADPPYTPEQLAGGAIREILSAQAVHKKQFPQIGYACTLERLVEIVFEDTGVGIPPDHLSKILDPFFTTKEKGTGLGLSVVYGIVERHHGKLDIRSEVGKGTRVTIRLPTVEASTAAAV